MHYTKEDEPRSFLRFGRTGLGTCPFRLGLD